MKAEASAQNKTKMSSRNDKPAPLLLSVATKVHSYGICNVVLVFLVCGLLAKSDVTIRPAGAVAPESAGNIEALYSASLVLAFAICFACLAIGSSSIRASKRRVLAQVSLCSVECATLYILKLTGVFGPVTNNAALLAFAGVGYWNFILPWRADWRHYLAGNDDPGQVTIWRMLLLANVHALGFLAPRIWPHPAVILCCHIPMFVGQMVTNVISFRVAWFGMKRNNLPFPTLYGAASGLGFTSGFVHVTEVAYLFGAASFIAAEAHLIFTVLARLLGCCCIVLYTIVTMDEHQRLKAELRAAEERVEAAAASEKDRQRFMRYVFHELRVPLNSVALGLALVLEEDEDQTAPLPQGTAETLQLLRHSTDTVMSIINDSLDLAKMEAGAMQLALGPVDVRDLVTNAVAQMWPFANGRKSMLNASIEPGVPRFILGDAPRLSQCLTNFLSNAIKFVAEGSGKVVLRVRLLHKGVASPDPEAEAVRTALQDPTMPRNSGMFAIMSYLLHGDSSKAEVSKAAPQPTVPKVPFLEDVLQPPLQAKLATAGFVVDTAKPSASHGTGEPSASTASVGRRTSLEALGPTSSFMARVGMGMGMAAPSFRSPPTTSTATGGTLPHTDVSSAATVSVRSSSAHEHHTVHVGTEGRAQPQGRPVVATLEFAVIDNGCGIEQHELGLLYQPFVQVEAGTKQKGKGTGLGLAIVKQIVHSHGGTVDVTSQVGQGSVFSFTIPCVVLHPAGRGGQDTSSTGLPVSPMASSSDGPIGGTGLAALRRYLGGDGSAIEASSVKTPVLTGAAAPKEANHPPRLLISTPQTTEGHGTDIDAAAAFEERYVRVSSTDITDGAITPRVVGLAPSAGTARPSSGSRPEGTARSLPRVATTAAALKSGTTGQDGATRPNWESRMQFFAHGAQQQSLSPANSEHSLKRAASESSCDTDRTAGSPRYDLAGGHAKDAGQRADEARPAMPAPSQASAAGHRSDTRTVSEANLTSGSFVADLSITVTVNTEAGPEQEEGQDRAVHVAKMSQHAWTEDSGAAAPAKDVGPSAAAAAGSSARRPSPKGAHILPPLQTQVARADVDSNKDGADGLASHRPPVLSQAPATTTTTTTGPGAGRTGPPVRWLFVDDVASNRRFLLQLMKRRYKWCNVFDECENGEVAVLMCSRLPGQVNSELDSPAKDEKDSDARTASSKALCPEWPYDVVCMDGNMPVLDGYEATRQLRAAGYPGLILGVTGNALAADIANFKASGADAVVPKPVRPEEVLALVDARYKP